MSSGGKPGVPGARRGAEAHIFADCSLGGELFLPFTASAQHSQVPTAFLSEEGEGVWGRRMLGTLAARSRGRRALEGRVVGGGRRDPVYLDL